VVSDPRRHVLENNQLPVPIRISILVQIDTGTPYSAFDPGLFPQLGIAAFDNVDIRTPSTGEQPHPADLYDVALDLVDSQGHSLHFPTVHVISCYFGADEGIRRLLGRDVLDHCRFLYDGPSRSFTLEFG
jgi:hypothetical protein